MGVRSRADAIGDGVLQVGALSTFASPYLTTLKFGDDNSKLWPRTDISLTNIYLGASISILGLLAIIIRPESFWRWWLLAVGAVFLACALGNQLPVRGWVYDYCPPTRYFRNTAMFRFYAMFCVMLLALLAARDLQAAVIKDSGARIWKQFPGAAVLIAAQCGGRVLFRDSPRPKQEHRESAVNRERGPRLRVAGIHRHRLVVAVSTQIQAIPAGHRWRSWRSSMPA